MTVLLITLLYIVGIALIIAEFFIPGGITGAFGAILVGVAVYLCFTKFEYGWVSGSALILLAVAILPVALIHALKRVSLKQQMTKDGG
jgi:membrane-bound serine protease (ClpP class)